ncbi:MAG: hypothetical protein ABH850_07015 [Candidatus Micrarchaeota archaeon]
MVKLNKEQKKILARMRALVRQKGYWAQLSSLADKELYLKRFGPVTGPTRHVDSDWLEPEKFDRKLAGLRKFFDDALNKAIEDFIKLEKEAIKARIPKKEIKIVTWWSENFGLTKNQKKIRQKLWNEGKRKATPEILRYYLSQSLSPTEGMMKLRTAIKSADPHSKDIRILREYLAALKNKRKQRTTATTKAKRPRVRK